jgi:DnaK suppressor protein
MPKIKKTKKSIKPKGKSVKSSAIKAFKTSSKKKKVKTKTAASSQKRKSTVSKPKKVLSSTAASKKKNKPKASTTPQKRKSTVSKPKRIPKAVVSRKKITPVKKKKKYSSLREKKIQDIKMSLLSQRGSLLDEAEIALNELPGQTVFPDLGDQASAETDRNFMLRLRGREQRLLKKIDEAIDRIENNIFGICEDCGEEVDIKRLEARPVTTMCIDCKTLQEEEEKFRES